MNMPQLLLLDTIAVYPTSEMKQFHYQITIVQGYEADTKCTQIDDCLAGVGGVGNFILSKNI